MHWSLTGTHGAALALLMAIAAGPASLGAQMTSHQGHEGDTMALYEEILGEYTWPITTTSQRAQAYFDQGMRLMYAYTPSDARRSFIEARKLDPSCAMCYWGEAWSIGPYLNGGMQDSDAGTATTLAQRAQSLASSTTPVEQAVIRALQTRYAPTHPSTGRRGLDSAYADAMAAVYATYPQHLEVATLYADALMLLEPRRGIWPMTKPSVLLIHKVLDDALAQDVGHPGACHAYIHATETTPRVTDAQACADLLGRSIPGASHINHMPSHTYNRVGRWGDATDSNILAWHTDQRAGQGEGFAIYPTHNLHMLLFSAAVDGQGAISMQAAKDYTKLVPADGASFQALTMVRFGRFDEVLELTKAPTHPIHEGLWAFGRGLAHLRLGSPDSAAANLARVEHLAQNTPDTRAFRTHTAGRLLGAVGNLLRAEMLRGEGRRDEALAAYNRAVELEAGLQYDEPEPLPFTARDYLGAYLLELGRAREAEEVYQATLAVRPHNGWSLIGLEQALRVQGRTQEADEAKARFERAWSRSEVWLPASRF